MGHKIFLYIPNIIGYIRLLFLVISWTAYRHPLVFLLFYCTSVSLDALDGILARKFQQTSAFGAWLDVVVDILGRSMLWCQLYPGFGHLIASLEWLTFVCTHQLGAKWKQNFINEPVFVKHVMTNHFRSWLGAFVISGIHVLPIWLYAHYSQILGTYLWLPSIVQYLVIGFLASGRALAMVVEMWCIWSHIQYLVSDEANRSNHATSS